MKEFNLIILNIKYYISRLLLSPIFPLIALLFWFIIFKSFDSSILLCDDVDGEVLRAIAQKTYTDTEKQTILILEQKLNSQILEYNRYYNNFIGHTTEMNERLNSRGIREPTTEQFLGYKSSLDLISMRHTMDEIRQLENSMKELVPNFRLPIKKMWFENTTFTTENIRYPNEFSIDQPIEKLNKAIIPKQ